MDRRKPQSIEHYMSNSGGTLASLMSRAKLLGRLENFIHQQLGNSGPSRQFGVMNVRQQTLVLWTANAAVATQLRFASDQILNKLQENKDYKLIQNISILIRPDLYKT